MDYFWGSVKLMLVVWGLAALISFAVAWIMKLIFAVIRREKRVTQAPAGAAPLKPASDLPNRSA